MRTRFNISEELVLDDHVKSRILDNGKEIAQRRRKKNKFRNGLIIGAVVLASVICPFSRVSHIPKEGGMLPLTVYAQEVSGKEALDLSRESIFSLVRTDTPMGSGYALQMAVENGYRYELDIEDMGTGLETIFSKDNEVFWIPDYWKDGSQKIYDKDGNELRLENASTSPVLNVCVYNQNNRLCTELSIQLHEEENNGSAELISLVCYPDSV